MKNYTLAVLAVIFGALAVCAIYVLENDYSAPKSGAYSIQTSGGGAQPVKPLVAATTTPCAIALPAATSSILHFSMTVKIGTSSAGTIVVGTSTSPYATSTTPFGTFVIGGNAQSTWTWSGTVNNDVASPSTYIVAGMSNGSAVSYGYTYGGTCSSISVTD